MQLWGDAVSRCFNWFRQRPVEIAYVTDVEGNLDYFDRWVERSGVLRYTSPGVLDFTHENAYFVFGGDAMDRVEGGIRFTRRLVSLKKRHPSRVFLLAGNRIPAGLERWPFALALKDQRSCSSRGR